VGGGQAPRRHAIIAAMSIPRARTLRANMTDAERALWRVLRDKQIDGHRFRRQQPIGPYVADFFCAAERLIIEVDGGQHGGDNDARRDAWFAAQGYRVLRFWNHDVLGNREGVVEAIRAALAKRQQPD